MQTHYVFEIVGRPINAIGIVHRFQAEITLEGINHPKDYLHIHGVYAVAECVKSWRVISSDVLEAAK